MIIARKLSSGIGLSLLGALALIHCSASETTPAQLSSDGGITEAAADTSVESSIPESGSDAGAADVNPFDAPSDADAGASTLTPAIWNTAWEGNIQNARVALSPQGDIVVAGAFGAGTLSTGVPGQVISTFSNDWYIAKLPAGGGPAYWLRQVSSTSTGLVSDVAVGPDGSIFVAGMLGGGAANVDYHGMPGAPAGSNNPPLAVLKLDPAGEFVWAHSAPQASGVAAAPNGDVFVAESVVGDASTTLAAATRIAPGGAVMETRTFGGSGTGTHADDVVVHSSGDPIFTFSTSSHVDFGQGLEEGTVTVRFDSKLDTKWSTSCKIFGTQSRARVAISTDDRAVVAGQGTPSCAGFSQVVGSQSFFLVYDDSGQLSFTHIFPDTPGISDLAVGPDGRIYVTGNNSYATASGIFIRGTDSAGTNPFAWIVPASSLQNDLREPALASVAPGQLIVVAKGHGTINLGAGQLLGFGMHGLLIAQVAP